jgi:cobalt-zinc-cadmium efflux system protein
MRGRKSDLNVKGAFLHMAADAGVSAGVVVAGLLITLTGWRWLDPVTSLLIVAVITISTWGLLRDSVNLALDAVPDGIDIAQVGAALRALPGVADVHDLHIWGLSTTETALTAHLVHDGGDSTALIRMAYLKVHGQFGIGHATFQVETAEQGEACELRPAHII